jgi:hypothetical protein
LVASLGLDFPSNGREASTFIETIKVECLNRYGNRAGSMRSIIADRISALGEDTAYSLLRTQIGESFGYGEYQRKLEFSANINGRRVPKPFGEQANELTKLVVQLADELKRRGTRMNTRETEQEQEGSFDQGSEDGNSSEEQSQQEATSEQENGSGEITGTLHPFLAKLREIRREEERRSEMDGKRTPILESVSGNRPAKNGAKMLKQGLPTEALLHALALDWPEEARRRYGINEYDVTAFRNGAVPEGRHPAYSYVHRAMQARIPIALIGPSGTGKSTLCQQIAEDMGLPYGMVPMTAGATPSWIVGAYTLDGYRTRSAVECFVNGGVFVFEEMDSADPNMLLVANNLIENDVFINPVTNESLKRSPDYIPVACMNTRGLGATAVNSGRSRLDDATRNRFAMGRVELFLDENLEASIFENILNG